MGCRQCYFWLVFINTKNTARMLKLDFVSILQRKKGVLIASLLFLLIFSCQVPKPSAGAHPIDSAVDPDVILPPAWSFGVLFGGYTDQKGSIERVKEIISHDYPIDGYWIDSWFWDYKNHGRGPHKYMDFVADTISFPDRRAMWDFFEANNIKGGFWVWDCIFETGNEEAFNDFKQRGYFRNIYLEKGSWHNKSTTTAMYEVHEGHQGTVCGNINFDDPEAVAYFKMRMKHFFDEGADFIKLDRSSDISVCKAMFEMTQELGKETQGRGFIMSHTGGVERNEFKRYPCKWTDDTRADWSLDKPTKEFYSWVPKVALKENIAMYTDSNRSSSQIPFLTQDLGGFEKGKSGYGLDEELYLRWMQFAMFCPIVEVFTQPENPTYNLPYLRSERADSLFRYYSHLRMQLFPYIYTSAHLARLEGKPMISATKYSIYDYMFGDDILVAPVFEQGATTRKITLPNGNWYNFFSDNLYEGGKEYVESAPTEKIPLFVKAGAIIPMRNYARAIEIGTNDSLTIHLYPGTDGSFTLIEDDGRSNAYLEGKYAASKMTLDHDASGFDLIMDPVKGSYLGMADKRCVRFVVHGSIPIKNITFSNENMAFVINGSHCKTSWAEIEKSDCHRLTVKWK